MQRNPFPGDHGAAYANIRPSYELSLRTAERGGECHVEAVTLDIRFIVTLPAARDERRMSARARQAWQAFVAFARRHEEAHRVSYLSLARAFVARARTESARTCPALRSAINQMLRESKRNSEAAQAAFDRQQKQQLAGLGLFRLARQ
jgi:predicted secreted Zn-dependent protease